MANTGLVIKHTFVSAKPDGVDTSVIRPSDWNDEHDVVGNIEWSNVANAPLGPAYDNANAAFDKANSANVLAYSAFGQANTAWDKANAANVIASGGFDKANAALANTSGVLFNGTLQLAGDLIDQYGYVRDIQVVDHASPYVLVSVDAGRTIATQGANVYVPNAVFFKNDVITLWNNSSSDANVVQTASVLLYNAGDGGLGDRKLGARGICTMLCVAANTFVISGAGMT